jgi:hypothetical protein
MRPHALAAALAALVLAAGCRSGRSREPAPTSFAMIVERSASGWRVQCERGCRWTEVSMQCAGCEVRLDAAGIARADAPAAAGTAGFAFVLSAADRGWAARGVRGVRWTALSWTCGGAVCRGRLDESGVSGA